MQGAGLSRGASCVAAPQRWLQRRRSTWVACSSPARHRRGVAADVPYIRSALLREAMSPLNIEPARFLVAEDDTGAPFAFGQLERKEHNVFEMRSIYVDSGRRGKGVGSKLVQALLETLQPGDEAWLVTIRSRINFYKQVGFVEQELSVANMSKLPRWLWLEAALGTVVARVAAGEQLCVMCRRAASAEPGP